MGAEQIPFAGSWIDRDVATRSSEAALEHAWNEPDARVLRVDGVNIPITRGELAPRLELIPTAGFRADATQRIFLGRRDGAPIFAVAVGSEGEGGAATNWIHPFEVALELSPAERELVVIATALARWHESALWSARDGELTQWADGGWSRRDARGGELFPRMDPAVIVLIEHEGKALLGSNTLWESGRFSLLAGFVEAGESLEQAVAREMFEEAGVRIGETRYMGSQPWPFPRSLMLGFRVQLAEGQDPEALVPDTQEISELRWFSREELANPPAGVRLPTRVSISGWLIAEWVSEGDR